MLHRSFFGRLRFSSRSFVGVLTWGSYPRPGCFAAMEGTPEEKPAPGRSIFLDVSLCVHFLHIHFQSIH